MNRVQPICIEKKCTLNVKKKKSTLNVNSPSLSPTASSAKKNLWLRLSGSHIFPICRKKKKKSFPHFLQITGSTNVLDHTDAMFRALLGLFAQFFLKRFCRSPPWMNNSELSSTFSSSGLNLDEKTVITVSLC